MLATSTLAALELAAPDSSSTAARPAIGYPTSAIVTRLTADSNASVQRADGTTSATVTRGTTSATSGPTFP